MTNTNPTLNKRKRGAQPGNTNSLKHGFYSHRFNNLEISDLGTALSDGLTDEIALVRVIIRPQLGAHHGGSPHRGLFKQRDLAPKHGFCPVEQGHEL